MGSKTKKINCQGRKWSLHGTHFCAADLALLCLSSYSLPLHFCVYRSLLPFKPAQCQNGLLFPFIYISLLFFSPLKTKQNKRKRKFFSWNRSCPVDVTNEWEVEEEKWIRFG
jgi:hypothetical protein